MQRHMDIRVNNRCKENLNKSKLKVHLVNGGIHLNFLNTFQEIYQKEVLLQEAMDQQISMFTSKKDNGEELGNNSFKEATLVMKFIEH